MKNQYLLLKGVIFFAALFSSLQLAAQNTDCKVVMPEISGTYVGDCKRGLAHGNGTATGTDRYEGRFSKGLPNGTGTYTWSNGTLYSGEWSKGIREGRGEMKYITLRGDSVVNGYWKAGNYAGKENTPSYLVIRKDNLLSANFRKTGTDDGVTIKLMMKGQVNSRVGGLSIVSSSGTNYKAGRYEGIQSVRYPLDIKITYRTNNPISRSSFDVVFECTINEPGRWEIVLNN
jgi:hypothetical protein